MIRTKAVAAAFSRVLGNSRAGLPTRHQQQTSQRCIMGDSSTSPSPQKGPELTAVFYKLLELFEKKSLLSEDYSKDKVVDFKHPAELQKLLPLQVSDEGCTSAEILAACETVIDYSVKTAHPRFLNQLFHRADPYGVMGSWMTDLLNTNEHTFEAAPVFILATKYLLQEFQRLLGYTEADIMFFPGGSMANFCAIHLARHRHVGGGKDGGMFGCKRLTMFASEECHYSVKKAAMFMGFGLDSVRMVKTNDNGKMCPDDLDDKIKASREKGEDPFFVMATSGTTVIGSFDPISAIADVCDKYKMWLHVDACWGGAVLFSKTHRKLMEGIDRSDSFNVSLHKMMGAPIQCVPFIVKDKDILADAYSFDVPYLFQTDKFYDHSFDMGNKTVQCGRRPDALKFWLMWKASGHQGFENHVDNAVKLARVFTEKMKKRPNFRPVLPEFEFVNISYWYIPPSMHGQPEDDEWRRRLHTVAPKIKERMTVNGNLMIGYQPQPEKERVNFFRIIIQNPHLTEADMDFVLDETERLGFDL